MVSPIIMSGGVSQLQLIIATGVGVRFVWGEAASSATSNAHTIVISSGDQQGFNSVSSFISVDVFSSL